MKIKFIFTNLIYDLIGRTVNFSIEKKGEVRRIGKNVRFSVVERGGQFTAVTHADGDLDAGATHLEIHGRPVGSRDRVPDGRHRLFPDVLTFD